MSVWIFYFFCFFLTPISPILQNNAVLPCASIHHMALNGLKSQKRVLLFSFWKIHQLATSSDFQFQGAISKPRPSRKFWVVSRHIWTHILGSRALFMLRFITFSLFSGGFWEICQLVTTSDLSWEGLIRSVCVSAFHRGARLVIRLKKRLSGAVLVKPILQSQCFWAIGYFYGVNFTLNRAPEGLHGKVRGVLRGKI